MEIPCVENCIYCKDGLCKKDNCECCDGVMFGNGSCPYITINYQEASKDHKHCEEDKVQPAYCVF